MLRIRGRIAVRSAAAPVVVVLCMAQPGRALDNGYSLLRAIDGRPKPCLAVLTQSEAATTAGGEAEPEVAVEAPAIPVAAEDEGVQPRLNLLWAGLISAGIVGGTAVNSFTDDYQGGFHVTNEGWFAEDAYVGGADKASHFVSYEIIARELATAYEYLGFERKYSLLGGFGVASLAGLVNEIGDGTNKYGFSYQDLLMDMFGAGTSVLVAATHTRDLFGFRFGLLPGPAPPRETNGVGRDYSHEIYTADLKFAGVVRRLGLTFWPARFLLASTTYGVQGYPYGAPSQRERLVGFEIGLNFEEMLYALDVTQDTWWGIGVHILFDNFRIPYTAIGFRYDLNHGNWYGPATGGTTM
jgi:hypothetical protein